MPMPDPQTTIPTGWKLVPIEPTDKMIDAMHCLGPEPDFDNLYRAAINAAPVHYSAVRGILKDV